MILWTFTMQTSICCMLTWMQSCNHGIALALSFAEISLPGTPRPSADVLPFPIRQMVRRDGFGGPATVIPLGPR